LIRVLMREERGVGPVVFFGGASFGSARPAASIRFTEARVAMANRAAIQWLLAVGYSRMCPANTILRGSLSYARRHAWKSAGIWAGRMLARGLLYGGGDARA